MLDLIPVNLYNSRLTSRIEKKRFLFGARVNETSASELSGAVFSMP